MDQFSPTGSFFLLKPPKLSFPLLFSLDLINVVLFLLAVLRFSLIKFREWSAAQLTSSSKLLSLPTSLLYFMISTAHWLPISSQTQKQSSSHLLSHCLWYSSDPPYLSQLLHLYSFFAVFTQILGSSMFIGWAERPWGTDPFTALDL